MRKFNMHEAKSNLSELVRRALEGEEIIIARNGEPVVRLAPIQPVAGVRPVGLHRVTEAALSDGFMEESMRPLSAQELEAWGSRVTPTKATG
jgi:prevent-host-death family protein